MTNVNCCWVCYEYNFEKLSQDIKDKQAGAELCHAQVQLEVVVETGVEFGVEVEAYEINAILNSS